MTAVTETETLPVLAGRLRSLAASILAGVAIGIAAQFAVTALLGQMGGEALYVRSLYIPVAFLFMALEEGFEVSTQVAAARYRGAGQPGRIRPTAGRLGLTGLACFAAAALPIGLLAPQLAALLDVDPAAVPTFVGFARWVAASGLLIIVTAVIAGTLRGWGMARAASTVTATVAVVQVAGVWLLGLVGGLGVWAVPIASSAGAVLGSSVGLVMLVRAGLLRRPTGAATRQPAEPIRPLLVAVGAPVAASYLVVSAVYFTSVWVLSGFGAAAVAGFGSATAVQTMAIAPALALGSAVAILMNQSLGAGLEHRLRPLLWLGVRYALGAYAVISGAALLAARPLAEFMTGDPATADATAAYLSIIGPSWLAFGLYLMLNMTLQQVRNGHIALGIYLGYLVLATIGGGLIARAAGELEVFFVAVAVGNVVGAVVTLAIASARLGRRTGVAT